MRGNGIENQTYFGKKIIAVRTLQSVSVLRLFAGADQANEASADVKDGTITPPEMQTKEYGPRHVPSHAEQEDPVLRCTRMPMATPRQAVRRLPIIRRQR
jgi:hypothetical protein